MEVRAKMTIAKTAPDALKMLWKAKKFLKLKNVGEIQEALEADGYNFTDKGLMKALQRAKFLTRKGKPGKYAYVQKHPYVDEEEDEE
jgi:hypothetical protein